MPIQPSASRSHSPSSPLRLLGSLSPLTSPSSPPIFAGCESPVERVVHAPRHQHLPTSAAALPHPAAVCLATQHRAVTAHAQRCTHQNRSHGRPQPPTLVVSHVRSYSLYGAHPNSTRSPESKACPDDVSWRVERRCTLAARDTSCTAKRGVWRVRVWAGP